MSEERYYLRYLCSAGHEPTMWSAMHSDRATEACKRCGKETEPHVIIDIYIEELP